MSRVVSTEVKLTTGEKVKVYYISEAFRKDLEFLLDTAMPSVLRRLNSLERDLNERVPDHLLDRLRFLEEILASSIDKRLVFEILEIVNKKDPSQSFRKHDIIYSMSTPFYCDLTEEIFQRLLKTGVITSRGGSWYRRGSNEMPTKM